MSEISHEKACANFLALCDPNQKGVLSSRNFLRQWYILGYFSFAERPYKEKRQWEKSLDDVYLKDEENLQPVEDEEVAGRAWKRYEAPAVDNLYWWLAPERIRVHASHRLDLEPLGEDEVMYGNNLPIDQVTLEDKLAPWLRYQEEQRIPLCPRCHANLVDKPSRCPSCGQSVSYDFIYPSRDVLVCKAWVPSWPDDYSISYLAAYVHVPKDLMGDRLILYVGSDTPYRIWLNSQEVGRYEGELRQGCWDQDCYKGIQLKEGWNTILVKLVHLTEKEAVSGLYVRLAKDSGEPLFVKNFADEVVASESELRITVGKPMVIGQSLKIPQGAQVFCCTDGTLIVHNYRSTDGGNTWEPFPWKGRDQGACTILRDSTLVSFESGVQIVQPGVFATKMYRSSDGFRTVQTEEVTICLPKSFLDKEDSKAKTRPALDHGLVEMPDGTLLATMYGSPFGEDRVYADRRRTACDRSYIDPRARTRREFPHVRKLYKYRTWVIRSTDGGRHWEYFSTVAAHPELCNDGFCEADIELLENGDLLCVMRTGQGGKPLWQCRSTDGGRSWSYPVRLRFNGVWPNLVRMSNGILALTYGRPDARIAFSLSGTGRDWSHETILFNGGTLGTDGYVRAIEISEGTLLCVFLGMGIRLSPPYFPHHRLLGVQVKVERLEQI